MASYDEVNKHSSLRISRSHVGVAPTDVVTTDVTDVAEKQRRSSDKAGSSSSKVKRVEVEVEVEDVSLELEGQVLYGKTCLCQPVLENRCVKKKETFLCEHWHFRLDQLSDKATSSANSSNGPGIAFGFCTRRVNVAKGLALVNHKKLSTTKRPTSSSYKSGKTGTAATATTQPPRLTDQHLKEAVSSQSVGGGGEPVSWCVYSSPATGTLRVCGENSARRYCKAFQTGDVVTLKVERKKADTPPTEERAEREKEETSLETKDRATDCNTNTTSKEKSSSSSSSSASLTEEEDLVLTRVSVLVNFVSQGVAFEFTGTSDLFAAVSLYGNGQRVRLLTIDQKTTQENHERLKATAKMAGKPLHLFSSASDVCERELSLVSLEIDQTKKLLLKQFQEARANLDRQEAEVMAALDRDMSKYTLPLRNQARLLKSLERVTTTTTTTTTTATATTSSSCPLVPVYQYETDVNKRMLQLKVKNPIVTDSEAFDDLMSQSQQLAKVEKELAKATKKLSATKEDLEKKKKILKRSNPLVPTDLVHHVYASGWDCCGGDAGQKAFWDKFLQVSAMEKLSIFTHPGLLSLWVEQKSPSCAASAVAGACNVLSQKWLQLKEENPKKKEGGGSDENIDPALSMQNHPSSRINVAAEGGKTKSSSSYQQKNENNNNDASTPSLFPVGIGTAGCLGLKGTDILEMYVKRWEAAVRRVRRDMKAILTIDGEDEEASEEIINLIERALEEKYGVEFHPKLADLNTFLSSCVVEAIENWEGGAEEEVKTRALHAFSQSKKEFEAKVKTWWTKRGGLTKLTAEKPSTAPIGNETILKIFDKVRDDYDIPLRTWKFMSSKKSQCQVSESDSNERIDMQWNSLKTAVANTSQVLLFHLQNHYSLIYAARETSADEGYGGKHLVRQVLVAKPGQQPCRWVDFTSVRETILSWVGHAIMGVELENEIDFVV